MKRLVKWFCKREVSTIILGLMIYVFIAQVLAKVLFDDKLLGYLVSTLYFPIMLPILQSVLESKKKNNDANVDASILRHVNENAIVWRDNTKAKTNSKGTSIIEVVNNGDVMIYSMYICVVSYTGLKDMLYIGEALPVGDAILVGVPARKKEIERIEITYYLNTEGRTKCFCGTKTKTDERIVFSKIRKYDYAKDTIDKKYDVADFKEAEKFVWKKS